MFKYGNTNLTVGSGNEWQRLDDVDYFICGGISASHNIHNMDKKHREI